MCKVYTGYCGTSEIEHGLCACTVDNPLAKARGLSLRSGAQTMLYLSLVRIYITRNTSDMFLRNPGRDISFPIFIRKEIETRKLERKSKQKISRLIDLLYRLNDIISR